MRHSQPVQIIVLVLLTLLGTFGQDASHAVDSQTRETVGSGGDESHWQPSNYFRDDTLVSLGGNSAESPLAPSRFDTQSPSDGAMSPANLRELRRPRFAFRSDWLTASDFDFSNYDIRVTVPTYPFFGPPPPMISVGFLYTDLLTADTFGLPPDLYQYSLGLSWVRPLKDKWMLRSMLGVALATDNRNTTSDAWQFRGGVFGVYDRSEKWQWVLGAIAIGRNDLPVVPAVGAVWNPRPDLKFDLTFPKPRASLLLSENESRQRWAYVGMELGGGTWAYERPDRTHDQLTYKDWRVVAGWDSLPAPIAGARFTPGRKFGLQIGYVFARKLEFISNAPDISLADSLMFGINTSF